MSATLEHDDDGPPGRYICRTCGFMLTVGLEQMKRADAAEQSRDGLLAALDGLIDDFLKATALEVATNGKSIPATKRRYWPTRERSRV